MHGFEWKDQRGLEGTGFVRALRSLLTAHLPVLLPNLKRIVKEELRAEMKQYRRRNCKQFRTFLAINLVVPM